jgi:hypothetical protein
LKFFYIYFCHNFRKINGRIKIFEKCTSGAVPHGGRLLPPHPMALVPGAVGHSGTSLVPALGRGGVGARTLPPSGAAAGPYRRATRRQVLFYFFSFHF